MTLLRFLVPMQYMILSLLAATSFVSGGVLMGYAQGFTRLWPSVGVYVSFLIGVTLQTMATNGSSVGLTYIIILGMEACLSVLGGVLLFSESYSTLKLAGIALVTIGIAFLRH